LIHFLTATAKFSFPCFRKLGTVLNIKALDELFSDKCPLRRSKSERLCNKLFSNRTHAETLPLGPEKAIMIFPFIANVWHEPRAALLFVERQRGPRLIRA